MKMENILRAIHNFCTCLDGNSIYSYDQALVNGLVWRLDLTVEYLEIPKVISFR